MDHERDPTILLCKKKEKKKRTSIENEWVSAIRWGKVIKIAKSITSHEQKNTKSSNSATTHTHIHTPAAKGKWVNKPRTERKKPLGVYTQFIFAYNGGVEDLSARHIDINK